MSRWKTVELNRETLSRSMYMLFPTDPAVYVFYVDGELKYVGSSACLRKRMVSYKVRPSFYENGYEAIDFPKFGKVPSVLVKFKLSRRFGDWLMEEARLIRALQPPMNKNGTIKAIHRPRDYSALDNQKIKDKEAAGWASRMSVLMNLRAAELHDSIVYK